MKFFTPLLICMILSSCIDFGSGGGSESSGAASSTNDVTSKALVYNFNPLLKIDASSLITKYPSMERISAGTPGVSGISMSADEFKKNPVLTLNSPGSDKNIYAVISLKDGSVVKEVLR